MKNLIIAKNRNSKTRETGFLSKQSGFLSKQSGFLSKQSTKVIEKKNVKYGLYNEETSNLMRLTALSYNTVRFSNSFVDGNRLEDLESNLYFYKNTKFVSEQSKESADYNPMKDNVHLDSDHFKDSVFLQIGRCIGQETKNLTWTEWLTDMEEIEEYAPLIWKVESHKLFIKNILMLKLYLKKTIQIPIEVLDASISESSYNRLSQLACLLMYRNTFKIERDDITVSGFLSMVSQRNPKPSINKLEKLVLDEEEEEENDVSILATGEKNKVQNANSYLYSNFMAQENSFMVIKRYVAALTLIKNLTLEIITKKERNNLSVCLKNVKNNIFVGTVGLFKLREKRSRSKRKEVNAPGPVKLVKIKSIPKEVHDEAFALKKKFMINKPNSLLKLLKANLFKYESCLNLYQYMNIKMHEYSGAFDPANTPAYLKHSGKMLSRSELTSNRKKNDIGYTYIIDNPKKINYPWTYNYDAISEVTNLEEKKSYENVSYENVSYENVSYEIHSISTSGPKSFELLKIHKVTRERHGGTKIGK